MMQNIRVRTRPSLILLRTAILGAGLLGASQASADFLATTSTSSSYSYMFSDGSGPGVQLGDGVGDFANLALSGPFPASPSSLGIAYHSVVGTAGAFDFLHNVQCLGYCEGRIDTVVRSVITNLGTDALSLRFDTLITAGHLGIQGSDVNRSAGFNIKIFEGDDPDAAAGLYHMAGQLDGLGVSDISGTGAAFNGLVYTEEGDGKAFNWLATDVSLFLSPLAPGETRIVSLLTTTFVTASGGCNVLQQSMCNGAQAAFGDPRTDGGGGGGFAAVGRSFVAAPSFVRVVELKVAAVPEPTTWATMMAGLAMIGGVLRRRSFDRRLA